MKNAVKNVEVIFHEAAFVGGTESIKNPYSQTISTSMENWLSFGQSGVEPKYDGSRPRVYTEVAVTSTRPAKS